MQIEIAVGVSAVVAVIAVVTLSAAPRATVAAVDVAPDGSFALAARLDATGRHRVWLRYDVEYGDRQDVWSLDGELAVALSGGLGWRDEIHLRAWGGATRQPARLGEGVRFNGADGWDAEHGLGHAEASVFLGSIRADSPGRQITIRGALAPAAGTRIRAATVLVTR